MYIKNGLDKMSESIFRNYECRLIFMFRVIRVKQILPWYPSSGFETARVVTRVKKSATRPGDDQMNEESSPNIKNTMWPSILLGQKLCGTDYPDAPDPLGNDFSC